MSFRKIRILLAGFCILALPSYIFSQSSCSSPYTLSPSPSGTFVTGNLQSALATGAPAGCGTSSSSVAGTSSNEYGVWYNFIATASSMTVTINNYGSNLTGANNLFVELLDGTCGSFTPVGTCQTGASSASVAATGLTIGKTYYAWVYVIGSSPTSNPQKNWNFSIGVLGPSQLSNDDCTSATSLTTSNSCSATTSNLYGSTPSSITAASTFVTGCSGTTTQDQWFSFVATASAEQISLSNLGSSFTAPGLELYSGSPASLTSKACGTTSIAASGLTLGATYYVRVYSTSAVATSSTNENFDICVVNQAPSNDDCANAVTLVSGTSCSSTSGNMVASTSAGNSTCSGTVKYDVWYKFVAQSSSPSISLTGLGSNFTNPGLEILSSCNLSSSLQCATGTTSVSLSAASLTVGQTYYIRVFSTSTGSIPASAASFSICVKDPASTSPSNEVFQQTILSSSNVLNDPWEVTYGADDSLWVTESKGYKVYHIDPVTGTKNTILDISQNATGGGLSSTDHTNYNVKFAPNTSNQVAACACWPQGGLAGLALVPGIDTATNKYVFVSYVYSYDSTSVKTNGGVFFTNRIVRFTYNRNTEQLESPVTVIDTLPGSSDHNSQRMIIAPVNGTYYLFYAAGDMGAGQFGNSNRTNYAQDTGAYQGKILRFRLTPDNTVTGYDQWIPGDNPFNGTKRNAIWSFGIRNNQGFAYANINGTDILYGASHGPYSDDEINIIKGNKNYGHPLVEGYASDGNYNGYSAGYSGSSLAIITSESANATAMGTRYQDPIYSAYNVPNSTVASIWNTTNNGPWPTEAWSGMDIYTNSIIPAWKNSLVMASLKKGRILRLKLDNNGTSIVQTNGVDTVPYFGSQNRYRDLAFAPNGRDMYVIMDKSNTTSGPSANNPSVVTCAGCLIKYSFLGYANNISTNKSTIPSYIPISTPATNNSCIALSSVTINSANQNNYLWVPFTGPDGNIVAEVNAKGNNLGAMTASYYENAGTKREDANHRVFADRSLTITPATQPTTPVSVRLYLTTAEFNAMVGAVNSQGMGTGISQISDLQIFKNSDPCTSQFSTTGIWITPTVSESFGSGGYVLQADISSFSSFYFGNQNMVTLPVQLISFDGVMQKNVAHLTWKTENEKQASYYSIERSVDGRSFTSVGKVNAHGTPSSETDYQYDDPDACLQQSTSVYYRLRIVDENGSFAYSKVIRLQCVPTGLAIDIYPNPVHETMKVRLSLVHADNVQIQVTDMAGRIIYSHARLVSAGVNEIELDTSGWPAQVYAVKVTATNLNVLATKNMIKQ